MTNNVLHGYFSLQEMYRGTGDTWVPRSRFAELFILDSDRPIQYPQDYNGLYVVFEHIERSKDRLPLAKASEKDLTGGYILDNEHNKTRAGQNETQVRVLFASQAALFCGGALQTAICCD